MQLVSGYPSVYMTFLSNMAQLNLTNQVIPFPAPSELAAQFLRRHRVQIDLLHLDAAHEYESVAADLRLWSPLVREGGVLLGDDYLGHWKAVRKAVDEFAAKVGATVEVYGHKWLLRVPSPKPAAWPRLPPKKWYGRSRAARGGGGVGKRRRGGT